MSAKIIRILIADQQDIKDLYPKLIEGVLKKT
jgi:hypothetical protein